MPPRRSRRADTEEESPAPTQTQRRRRDDTPEEDEDVDMEDAIRQAQGSGSVEQLAKGLVRYALSCEHSRKPIKRADINEKGDCIGKSIQDQADCCSPRLLYSPVQRCLCASKQPAHGRLRHAVCRTTQSGEGDAATEARYVPNTRVVSDLTCPSCRRLGVPKQVD
jgi:hypothetical protein